MKRFYLNQWFLGVFFGLIFSVQAHASTKASFLESNPGAHLAAVGHDQVAAYGFFEAFLSNPASLTRLTMPELWLTHNQALLDSRDNMLGFGLPLKTQALGASFQYSDVGVIKRIGIADGLPVLNEGEFRPYNAVLQLGWARSFQEKVDFGLTAKGWHQELDKTNDTGIALDTGFQFRSLFPNFDIAIAAKNLGDDDYPRTVALGGQYQIPLTFFKSFSLLGQLESASHRPDAARMGLEFKQWFYQLRAGYSQYLENKNQKLGDISFGGGVQYRGWRVDYAWQDGEDLDDQHLVSLTLGFGLSQKEKELNTRKLEESMRARIKDKSNSHVLTGNQAMDKGQWPVAIYEYRRALNWDPNNKQAKLKLQRAEQTYDRKRVKNHLAQGNKYLINQKWIDAALEFREGLKINPENKSLLIGLKKAKRKISRSKRSMNTYRVKAKAAHEQSIAPAVSNDMAIVDSLTQTAYTHFMLGNMTESVATWEKILVLDPNNKDAKWALREINQTNPQQHQQRQKRRVRDLNAEALESYSSGNHKKALTLWNQALRLDPRNVRIQNNIKRVEKEIRMKEDAR